MRPIHLIIALLALAVIVLLLLWPSETSQDTSVWKSAIQESEVKIKALGLQNQALRDSLKKDSIIYLQEKEWCSASRIAKPISWRDSWPSSQASPSPTASKRRSAPAWSKSSGAGASISIGQNREDRGRPRRPTRDRGPLP